MESLKNQWNNDRINFTDVLNDVRFFLDDRLKESQIIQDQTDALFSSVNNLEERERAFLNLHIEQLDLPRRVYVALLFNSIDTLDNLVSLTPKNLLKLPMLGHTAVTEIQKGLQKIGLSLA